MSDETRYPSVRQVERLYVQIIAMTGGEHGYLSKSNLAYLLDAVKDIGERLERKQALANKAAYLLYNIIVLHPFLNGNKRTAYQLVDLFLRLNGYEIRSNGPNAYQFLLDIASSRVSAADVDRWVAMNLTSLSQSEIMAEQLRTVKEFEDKEFDNAMVAALEKNKDLLKKLAKV